LLNENELDEGKGYVQKIDFLTILTKLNKTTRTENEIIS